MISQVVMATLGCVICLRLPKSNIEALYNEMQI